MTKILDVYNPVNNELVGSLPLQGEREVLKMVNKANIAKVSWANTPLHERTRIINKFVELIKDSTEDIAVTLSKEMGKPIIQSRAETAGSANIARGFIERANHLYGEVLSTDNQPGFEKDLIFTKREPLGLIFCIIPFNYPIELFVHKVVPAVIMGNVVIVKAPSDNPLAMMKLGKLFEKTGLPEGVVQCLVCSRDVSTKHLVSNKNVQAISHTGNTVTGIKLAHGAADTLKHIFLENSGNDGIIIREDADLDFAVEEMMSGRIYNAGQTCCAVKRIIVQSSIADKFTEELVERLRKVNIGDPLDESVDMSTVISENAANKVISQVQHTINQGAKCIYGGNNKGAFVEPTVLVNVTKDMDIAQDLEVFGPVFPIIKYDTDEEAIEIVNSCQYGLSSGIITKDLQKAIKMGSKIEAGAVVLNGQGSYRHMEQAFGGYKLTGLGREGVSTTLEEHSQVKSYIIKSVF